MNNRLPSGWWIIPGAIIGLIISVSLALALASAVLADTAWDQGEVTFTESDGNPCVVVEYRNSDFAWDWKVTVLHTSHGPVTVKQHVTPCTTQGPDCADDLEALDWPAALTPVQQRISVPEGETGRMEFLCWEGA